MKMGRFEPNRCDYSFNETETTENGGRIMGDSKHPSDPPRCLQNCKDQFLEKVSDGYDEDFSKACVSLTKDGPNQLLWPLYWCDSEFCGVYINRNGSLGQDPNVDLIINQCQNIGFYSIFDPGPPPLDYSCSADSTRPDGATSQNSKLQLPAQTATSADTSNVSTTVPSTPTSSILTTASGTPAATTTTDKTEPLGSDAPPAPSATLTRNLSTGAKAAIGACSGLGLLALISLALFLLRWRVKRRSASPTGVKARIRLRRDQDPDISPSPLISATRSTATASIRSALTPPLRLRDRKFLPSILRPSNRSPSPPLTPLTPVNSYPGAAFPSSPICSPTTNRLVPRHELGPKPHGGHTGPQVQAAAAAAAVCGPAGRSRGSLSSSFAPSTKSSTTTTTAQPSLRNETLVGSATPSVRQAVTSAATTAGGPPRPPRPHEAPLEIPDLVKPAEKPGPPPNKALPVAPVPAPAAVMAETEPARRAPHRGASWGSWDDDAFCRAAAGKAHGIGIAVSPPDSQLYFPKEMVLSWGPGVDVAVEVDAEAEAGSGSGSSLDEQVEPASRRVSVLREEVLERLGGGY